MANDAQDQERAKGPLAIVCGGGTLPFAVADAAARSGRRPVLFGVRGFADSARIAAYRHHWVSIGQIGRICRLARDEGCRDMMFIGSLIRPAVHQIRFDFATLRMLPRIIAAWRGGDNHLLSGVTQIFEHYGFRFVGAHEVAGEILIQQGLLANYRPSADDQSDIEFGLEVLRTIGGFDIGQAVVVAGKRVLAIEAAEGTDAMLERVAVLRQQGRIRLPDRTGVLVKAPKPQQDRRFDLPSIGPQTIEGVRKAGLAGLAVVAGGTIVADGALVTEAGDRDKLFIVGVRPDGTWQ